MGLFPLEHETIVGTASSLRAGETTAVRVLERCFDRIEEWEGRVRAWVRIDRAGALEQAARCDAERAEGKDCGPLHGIPFGMKDIIDVRGLPTAAGFSPWRERVATEDADVVARLRSAGAVILGKTVTTQFAWIDPPPTRNPWDLGRTPGGSSSGSAVAVALGMCLGALGSQTGGSVIRPASFCGVVGYKPSSSLVSARGIVPLAPTLDHPGAFARTVADVGLIAYELYDEQWKLLGGLSECEPHLGVPVQAGAPRLVRPRGFFDRRTEPETLAAFEAALGQLAAAGSEIADEPDEAFDFEGLLGHHRVLLAAEAAAAHEGDLREHSAALAPHALGLVREGLALPVTRYVRSQQHWQASSASRLDSGLDFDVLVTPATVGPAPGVETTGNPCLNSPWSYLGWPAVSVPFGLSPEGLPLGLQLVGRPFTGEPALFCAAAWCESVFRDASRARGA